MLLPWQEFTAVLKDVENEIGEEIGPFRIFLAQSRRPSGTLWNVVASADWANSNLESSEELLRDKIEAKLRTEIRPLLNHVKMFEKLPNSMEPLLAKSLVPAGAPPEILTSATYSNGFQAAVFLIRCVQTFGN